MRVVFMGTPQLASTVLEELCHFHDVVGVFTRPDAIRGRGKKLVASAVKTAAVERGIPVYTPESLREADAVQLLRSLEPDCICVAAYGCLLPKEVLDIPVYGCLNVHTSLLPRWRGAAPIERAILAGDEVSGVCIMRMEEGLDTGPYCVRREVPVSGRYVGDLTYALAHEGALALLEALESVDAGTANWQPQGDVGLVYADKIGKGELDFGPDESVSAICAKVRAASDSHPSRTQVAGKRIAVLRAAPISEDALPQGACLDAEHAGFIAKKLLVSARDGLVELEEVKPDGKKAMEGRSFAAGIQGIKNSSVKWERA